MKSLPLKNIWPVTLVTVVVLFTGQVFAFNDASKVNLKTDTLIFVTHATTVYDPNKSTERALSELLDEAKESQAAVISLQDPRDNQGTYFLPQNYPLAGILASGGGEFDFHNLKLPVHHVITTGGFFEMCEFHTVLHLMADWALHSTGQQAGNLKITYFAPALFTQGAYVFRGGIGPSPLPQPDLRSFVDGGTEPLRQALQFSPNSSIDYFRYVMSEAIEVLQYHKPAGVDTGKFIENSNVVLSMNGQAFQVIKKSNVPNAPTLTFELFTLNAKDDGAAEILFKN
jgi:hypothetical protein